MLAREVRTAVLAVPNAAIGPLWTLVAILRDPDRGAASRGETRPLTETLTESFCERCGTRYEFKAPTRLNPLRKTRGFDRWAEATT